MILCIVCRCMVRCIYTRSIVSIYLPVWPVRIIRCHVFPCIRAVVLDLSKPYVTLLCIDIISNPVVIILYCNTIIVYSTIFCGNAKCHSVCDGLCICQHFIIFQHTDRCGCVYTYVLFYCTDSGRILLCGRNINGFSGYHICRRFQLIVRACCNGIRSGFFTIRYDHTVAAFYDITACQFLFTGHNLYFCCRIINQVLQ